MNQSVRSAGRLAAIPDASARIATIQAAIIAEGQRLEARHPLLRRRDLLGTLACLGSCGGMLLMGALYIRGIVPWWATLIVSGFLAGILNEVEHDLMHFLYFRRIAARRRRSRSAMYSPEAMMIAAPIQVHQSGKLSKTR